MGELAKKTWDAVFFDEFDVKKNVLAEKRGAGRTGRCLDATFYLAIAGLEKVRPGNVLTVEDLTNTTFTASVVGRTALQKKRIVAAGARLYSKKYSKPPPH